MIKLLGRENIVPDQQGNEEKEAKPKVYQKRYA
jgi:hypothetical protein